MTGSRAVVAALLTVLLAGSAAGCSAPEKCDLERDGTAACGVLLGVTTERPDLASLEEAEAFAGRAFDLVYRFHEIDDAVPTAEERRLVEEGRALHLSLDTRVDNSRDGLSWADVAAGGHDGTLTATATGLAALHRPVFVTFEHEMDAEAKQVLGSSEQFVAAWRHVHEVFEAAGASNVIWVWVAAGTEASIPRAATMWPGNDVVDWISWDVYNPMGCRLDRLDPARSVTFEDALAVFSTWLKREGPSHGIDVDKPKMISETGSAVHHSTLDWTASWYQSMAGVLERNPDIRAVGLWDHTGNQSCDYRFTGYDSLRPAVRELAHSDVFASLRLGD